MRATNVLLLGIEHGIWILARLFREHIKNIEK